MSQSVNLSVSGVYTSMNDFNGLPQGALNEAKNVECRYKNLLEPRRGFEGLADSSLDPITFRRLVNFYIDDIDRIIGLDSNGDLFYYDANQVMPWVAVPGFSTGVINPDDSNGKSRFNRVGQNLYVTSQDGIRSLSSGTTALMLRAGIPKGLNIEATTDGSVDGFFNNNVVLATVGDITSGGPILTNLVSTVGVAVGQYVTGIEVPASLVIQDLTYTAALFGVLGNAITVAYTTGGTAGAEVVTVVGNAVSVKIQSGVSTATQVSVAVTASVAASALLSVAVSGTGATAQTAPVAATHLAGALDNTIPVGTKVLSITDEATVIIQNGAITAGSVTIGSLSSSAGIVAGLLVSGPGITEGSKVVSLTGGGPYSVDLDLPAFEDLTASPVTFDSPTQITLDQNAAVSLTGTPLSFYSGSQVGYRIVYGRVETDINHGTITRLGSATPIAVANNISPYSTNVSVMATLPKNSDERITFYQLYRSPQTSSISITPLDQYNLVFEAALTPGDFTARTITIDDTVPDSLVGIPLYSGSDREGILQSNDPPPMCWDMAKFRDFALFGNATQPSTLKFTVVAVGSPNGVQIDDVITLAGDFAGVPFSRTYTGKSTENQAAHQFQIVTGGTPSQNITDTVNSLIRVINYDESCPVHAILVSTTTDLPGQILLEADNPSFETFTATASAHTDAYDPALTGVVSTVNTKNNGVYVSKAGEQEAVPGTNLLNIGDSSSEIIRVIALRDYVLVLKTDGIYKIQGIQPGGLIVNPFDLTTKIIGAETAVSLNSGVWMLSNQGVVSISDGGVDAKSIPIDDQLNLLIESYKANLADVSFGVGYESDRKYILSVPNANDPFTEVQHVFCYVTNSWTSWERNLYTAYVHSSEGRLYISRADSDNKGVSKERKTGTYTDYVDEAFDVTISSVVSAEVLILSDASRVTAGDILFVDSSTFSPILDVDTNTGQITVQSDLGWAPGAAQVLAAYECQITWKQVFGENPAFVKQFSEGLVLFKVTRFNSATMSFVTDFSSSGDSVVFSGGGNGLWGLFAWGGVPWGGVSLPQAKRFYVAQTKQLGSYLIPTLTIRQGYSNFKIQGLSLTYYSVSQEVGQ